MHILNIAPEQIPLPPLVGGSVEQSIYQIAKGIVRLAKNPSTAKKLTKQARRDVTRKFSWRSTARKLEKIYSLKIIE